MDTELEIGYLLAIEVATASRTRDSPAGDG